MVSPKYSTEVRLPQEMSWLSESIEALYEMDTEITGISSENSWCYATVRSGPSPFPPDNEWHLDGGSLRTELIPERNYVYQPSFPLEYREGTVTWDEGFNPYLHNMFHYIRDYGTLGPIQAAKEGWNLLWPNVYHRRPPGDEDRTFIRITMADIEIRDARCNQNPMWPKQRAYGRNPAASFRDQLSSYRRP